MGRSQMESAFDATKKYAASKPDNILSDYLSPDRMKFTDEPGKGLFLSGYCIECDTPGINGRVYPTKKMSKEVDILNKDFIAKNRLISQINHPRLDDKGQGKDYPIFEFDFTKVGGLIRELRMDKNWMWIKIQLDPGNPTQAFQGLLSMMRLGYVPGFSIRGAGSEKQRPDGYREITDDYTLITVDIVANPSYGDRALATATTESVGMLGESVTRIQKPQLEAGYRKYNKDALISALRSR
jgi:hypothetical protein